MYKDVSVPVVTLERVLRGLSTLPMDGQKLFIMTRTELQQLAIFHDLAKFRNRRLARHWRRLIKQARRQSNGKRGYFAAIGVCGPCSLAKTME